MFPWYITRFLRTYPQAAALVTKRQEINPPISRTHPAEHGSVVDHGHNPQCWQVVAHSSLKEGSHSRSGQKRSHASTATKSSSCGCRCTHSCEEMTHSDLATPRIHSGQWILCFKPQDLNMSRQFQQIDVRSLGLSEREQPFEKIRSICLHCSRQSLFWCKYARILRCTSPCWKRINTQARQWNRSCWNSGQTLCFYPWNLYLIILIFVFWLWYDWALHHPQLSLSQNRLWIRVDYTKCPF